VSACKVAAVVCTAALTAGGAVEVRHLTGEHRDAPARTAVKAAAAPAVAPSRPAFVAPVADHAYAPKAKLGTARDEARGGKTKRRTAPARTRDEAITAPPPVAPTADEPAAPVVEENTSGGALAPPATGEEPAETAPTTTPPATEPTAPEATTPDGTTTTPPADPGTGTPPGEH
jgi:hypothetical protein